MKVANELEAAKKALKKLEQAMNLIREASDLYEGYCPGAEGTTLDGIGVVIRQHGGCASRL